jgi:hypothetical protein
MCSMKSGLIFHLSARIYVCTYFIRNEHHCVEIPGFSPSVYIYKCVYICVHVYVHVWVHTYIHTHTFAYIIFATRSIPVVFHVAVPAHTWARPGTVLIRSYPAYARTHVHHASVCMYTTHHSGQLQLANFKLDQLHIFLWLRMWERERECVCVCVCVCVTVRLRSKRDLVTSLAALVPLGCAYVSMYVWKRLSNDNQRDIFRFPLLHSILWVCVYVCMYVCMRVYKKESSSEAL